MGLRLHPPFFGGEIDLIDRYLDSLPSIDDFLEDRAAAGQFALEPELNAELELDADGWALASWQSYDWSDVAQLGAPQDEADAEAAWIATDWTPVSSEAHDAWGFRGTLGTNHPTADEVAFALDAIARKIRSGELSIDQFRGTPPEAAVAAALAAMLELWR
ncbi:MAG: hypothetical protein WKF55_05235 [Gemmatimonadaceae bacterium]